MSGGSYLETKAGIRCVDGFQLNDKKHPLLGV